MRLQYRALNAVNGVLLRRNLVVTPSLFQRPNGHALSLAEHSFDYIRAATIREALTSLDERGIDGDIAELGVYQGRTSALMNATSPDRTLYLFDTFEGFDERDLAVERANAYSHGKVEFEDTSEAAVMARMPHPAHCIPVKGFFPESAGDVDAKFALAVIDVDLYQPILEGLRWFWPRLAPGGVIFVHDFGTTKFKGARAAVQKFSAEQAVHYLPLPDTAGSVVFIKS
ncbi:TylF/MycF/NovP-related O-methyltransferase [Euzebya rosea]|uniref:TylF/MycF/NovP-related O-methyltransferase n=1 Tax=Euzebya rosea TaxID=2052804 RepID=UPI000D3E96D9|nr:TylF/MycF/NovP-related O-methyltransferase [Euzebya rosea]